MAQLQFEITNQVIKRTDTFRVVADSKDYLYAKFTILTDDWGDGQKTAIFIQDENSYRVLLDANGECLVPWEVLINNAVVRVSVFSGTRVTANYAQIFVEESGYVDNAIYPDNPTPTVYEEIIAMIDDAVEEAKTAAEADAEAAAGSAEDAAGSAEAAAQSVRDAEDATHFFSLGVKIDEDGHIYINTTEA